MGCGDKASAARRDVGGIIGNGDINANLAIREGLHLCGRQRQAPATVSIDGRWAVICAVNADSDALDAGFRQPGGTAYCAGCCTGLRHIQNTIDKRSCQGRGRQRISLHVKAGTAGGGVPGSVDNCDGH